MQAKKPGIPVVVALGLLALTAVLSGTQTKAAALPQWTQGRGQVEWKVDTGDYEVVANWPQPLPDGPDGVKHAGFTWGSRRARWRGDLTGSR